MTERFFFFEVLREIEKHRQKNLKGKVFWDSLVLFFHHSENLQRLQVDVTLTLKVTCYKSYVFLCFVFCIRLLLLSKNRIRVFNPNSYDSWKLKREEVD